MQDICCPYCNHPQDIDHDDGYGYKENETYQQQCSDCGKIFIYNTFIHFSYDVYPADCLNGAEHKWRMQVTYPKAFSQMICDICSTTRKPTSEEEQLINTK